MGHLLGMNVVPTRRVLQQVDDADRVGGFPFVRERDVGHQALDRSIHLDLHVEDFDGVLDKVRAQGGAIENEFRTQGPRPTAFCSDPFGNGFCVIGERIG